MKTEETTYHYEDNNYIGFVAYPEKISTSSPYSAHLGWKRFFRSRKSKRTCRAWLYCNGCRYVWRRTGWI